MAEFIGRLHPLIVHLPIGIIVLAFLMELASRSNKWKNIKNAIPFVLQMAVIFSILAWATGWILPKEGQFEENLIGQHFWFAVAMTVATLITYLLSQTKIKKLRNYYFPSFCLTMILLTLTGHFGGSLTHGENYLSKPIEEKSKIQITDVDSLVAYKQIIKPILKQKCFSCHNEGKKKGGLVMSSIDGLKLGGDEGPIIVPGNVNSSSMVQRLHLPIENDGHMPPSGKRQLSNNEIKLVEWWIDQGADYNKRVGDLKKNEEISEILKAYEQVDSHINTRGLKIVGQDQLNKYSNQGLKVYPISKDNPLVKVNLSRDTTLSAKKLKSLKHIADNIVELDLSFTNLDDKMIAQISRFKNLKKLKIQQTNISSKGIKAIEGLDFLEYLNLYGTTIDSKALASIKKMKSLKSLFLWQTNLKTEEVKKFAEAHPLLNINFEIEESIFGDAKLKPPLITTETDIFEDSIRVAMGINFKAVKIYYTTDGTLPDSTSNLYTKPFLLEKTAAIKAICLKEGWGQSDHSEKVLIKAGHKIVSGKLTQAPNKKYKAKGVKSLYDFEKGSTSFVDGKWLGYEGKNMIATLDLGIAKKIKNVVVGALEDTGSYIFFPKAIEVSTSNDGHNFNVKKRIDIPISDGPNPSELKSFLLEFEEHSVRYVKTIVFGTLKNPAWHAAPGAKNWIFVDEILVN